MRTIIETNSLTPDTELFRRLCLAIGPSGFEEDINDIIKAELEGICDRYETDRLGNTFAYVGNDPKKKTLAFFAHMDEVGFLITGVSEEGLLYFSNIGGIMPTALMGRRVTVRTLDNRDVYGVISTKPVHMLSPDERKQLPHADDMFIDVGATDKKQLEGIIETGCFASFIPTFEYFGENGKKLAAKAIDDRIGCAVMLCMAREYCDKTAELPVNLVFAFTVREEIGNSGANVACERIKPDYAVILESTAASDIAGVPASSKVAITGEGGAVSFMDKSTVYDRGFKDFVFELAAEKDIPVQLKKFVSGGNDAGAVHRAAGGIRTLALSTPSRYIHSAACVIGSRDYDSVFKLTCAIAENADMIDNY
ncbi:MAG: M20/M25/M40 family metallo-hydrolase [Clostridia bacterium]|nr:M20/M25/M40 family metallo-hydrolase [Clostridia bacterium]